MKTPKLKINGVVLLDKPIGISSNHALQAVKRLYNAEKAGHAGTLDPMASGMLPICLGQATKLAEYLLAEDKCYRAVVKLGLATTTGDKEGEVIAQQAVPKLDRDKIAAVLAQFRGPISQIPPMYSALKHQGQALYKLARQGETVERKTRDVHIYQLELLESTQDTLTIEVKCSKGTYIRTLGEDIAKALGTVGHLTALRRLYSGGFNPDNMLSLACLTALPDSARNAYILPMEALLPSWPMLEITSDNLTMLLHGKTVTLAQPLTGQFRLFLAQKLLAIAKLEAGLVLERKLLLNNNQ